VDLELVKIAVLRNSALLPSVTETELRLDGLDGEDLLLAWVRSGEESLIDYQQLPRRLYDEIAADSGWGEMRRQLETASFVDFRRSLVGAAPGEVGA
jgi:hypothetical protein